MHTTTRVPANLYLGDTTTSAIPRCPYCSGQHLGTCPRVKAIEYHPNGTVKRVEFKDAGR